MRIGLRLRTLWAAFEARPGPRWRRWGLAARDMELRRACLERAAQLEDLDGMVALGDLRMSAARPDPAAAERLFRGAAERGHVVGAFALAELIRWERKGPGAAQDSFPWFLRAAEGGFPPAMLRVAQAYGEGEGVAVDPERARTWTERAEAASAVPEGTWVEPDRSPLQPLRRHWDWLEAWMALWAERPWYPFALALLLVLTSYAVFGYVFRSPSCGLALAALILGSCVASELMGPFARYRATRRPALPRPNEPVLPPSRRERLRDLLRDSEERPRWQQPSLVLTTLAALVVMVGLWRFTVRNAEWLGRRDRERVVWGDLHQRVAAPRDAHASIPIPAARRKPLGPVNYWRLVKDGWSWIPGQSATLASLQPRPALLVVATGRFPAFQETLREVVALDRAMAGRATVLLLYVEGREDSRGLLTQLSFELDWGLAAVSEGASREAFGDLSYTPLNLVLDAQGRIRQRWEGFQPGLMRTALEDALREAAG
jgi:hypothetical protein